MAPFVHSFPHRRKVRNDVAYFPRVHVGREKSIDRSLGFLYRACCCCCCCAEYYWLGSQATHHPLKATPPLSCWPSQQQQQRHGAPHPAQLQGSTWVSQLWTGEKMDEESGGNITRVGGGGGSVVELYSASPFSSIASLNIRDRESRVDATTTSSSRNRSELLFSP